MGRRLADRLRGLPRRDARRRPALLRLLPAGLRAAAAPADGHRAARGVAARVASQPRGDVRLAGRGRARRRHRAARTRRRLVAARPRRVHVLGLRRRDDRPRVRARHARPPRARGRVLAGSVLGAHRSQQAPLWRLRRARGDRAARDRDRRLERLRHGPRGAARSRAVALGRRLHVDPPRRLHPRGPERDGDPRQTRRAARRGSSRHARGREERLRRRGAGVERGRHPHGLPARRGPVRGRRPGQSRRQRRLPGLRQAAREPALARRPRLPARLGDRALAGRARAAAPRGAVRRGRHAMPSR